MGNIVSYNSFFLLQVNNIGISKVEEQQHCVQTEVILRFPFLTFCVSETYNVMKV